MYWYTVLRFVSGARKGEEEKKRRGGEEKDGMRRSCAIEKEEQRGGGFGCGKAPHRAVYTGPPANRYVDRQLPGGTA
ncbi:hypothetical protein BHE74_00046654 [Ensete ventricosum]|nr:hypothetical protein GW17_00023173 [Ensete ventricosum]RWW47367.1 hypothetical protein BHE74_00046654 [Ensete ventricosum]RZR92635.1 hypothetical protein BHM03_00020962 [Ensete ventricosum]